MSKHTPNFYLTADSVILRDTGPAVEVLLVQRRENSSAFPGMWALPGGFVKTDETLLVGAARELKEETGLDIPNLRFFRVYDRVDRDPRGRILTAAHLGWQVAKNEDVEGAVPVFETPRGMDDAQDAKFWNALHLPPLAFDHEQIIREALEDCCVMPSGFFDERGSSRFL